MKISQQGVGTAALLIVAGAVAGRIVGFLRETAIAYQFGATAQTDAYLVASVIPMAIAGLVAGAVTVALVPVFTEWRMRAGEGEAWAVAGAVFGATALLLAAGAAVFFVVAPHLVPLIGPGLSPESKALAVRLSRLLTPIIVILGLGGVVTAILHALKHFAFPAFAGILHSIGMIAGVLLLGPTLGLGGLAVGSVAGALANLLVLSAFVVRPGAHYRPALLGLGHPGVRQIGLLALPLAAGSVVGDINLFVERILASGLQPGSIAALNFALRVRELPVGILATAVAVAVFPYFAQQAADARIDRLRQTLSEGLRMLWLVLFPTMAGLVVLREPIIRLLFERGAFDARATGMTASALLYYSVGIVAVGAQPLLARTFYALQDTATPVKIGMVAVAANIALNLILVRHLAHGGLALASSLSAIASFLLLAYSLRARLGYLDGGRIVRSVAKFALASVVMGAVVAAADGWSAAVLPGAPFLLEAARVGGLVVLGVAAYAAASALLRSEELAEAVRRVVARVPRVQA